MTLADLVSSTPWARVSTALLGAYPDADAAAFARVYAHLRGLKPQVGLMRIALETVPEGADSRVLVSGYDGTLEEVDPGPEGAPTAEVRFSLLLEPWESWLGMAVDAETEAAFSAPEILAHCLWTMTFDGSEELGLEPRIQWQRQPDPLVAVAPEAPEEDLQLLQGLGEHLRRSLKLDAED